MGSRIVASATSAAVTGKVITHDNPIRVIVDHRADRFTAPIPNSAPHATCVVDIGRPSREATIASAAFSYLLWRIFAPGPEPTPAEELSRRIGGVNVYPHSGFAFHRHGRGQTSFSWRNSIMALPLTSDGIYTVAPASNSFLGTISVKDRPDSHDLVSLHIDEHEDSFAAALVMDRAQGSVRQEVLFASLPDGTMISDERLTARARIVVERVEQGFLRIVNEDYGGVAGDTCTGTRTLHRPDGSETFRGYATTDAADDVARSYDHPAWINVDDRLGIHFQGTGVTEYCNRHYFNPWWAVADDLTLSAVREEREYRADDVVSRLTAVLAPDEPHDRTARRRYVSLVGLEGVRAIIADGWLVACGFGAGSGEVRFGASIGDFDDGGMVPVFRGTAYLGGGIVTYALRVEPGGVILEKTCALVGTDAPVEVFGVSGGRVFARNAGMETATLRTSVRAGALPLASWSVVGL